MSGQSFRTVFNIRYEFNKNRGVGVGGTIATVIASAVQYAMHINYLSAETVNFMHITVIEAHKE